MEPSPTPARTPARRWMRLACCLALLCMAGPGLYAQPAAKFLPKSQKVLPAGVLYDAHRFADADWDRDFARIAALGFSYVRLADKAWVRLEPKPNSFDLLWLDRCLDLAARYKLKVILTVPLDAPPGWLIRSRPGLEARRPDGRPYSDAAQYRATVHDDTLQTLGRRLATVLAKRYGQNAAILGYSLCLPIALEYSLTAEGKFRTYMQTLTRQNLDTLNLRWGTAQTATAYSGFDEIRLQGLTTPAQNPRLAQDFVRFAAQAAAAHTRALAEAIRKHAEGQHISTPTGLATTAQLPDPLLPLGVDFAATQALPRLPADFTPGAAPKLSEQWTLPFDLDLARSVAGRTGQDLLPLAFDGRPAPPGLLRRLIWMHYGARVDYLTLGPYRQPGSDVGLVAADGNQLTRLGQEATEALGYIESLKGYRMAEAATPQAIAQLASSIAFNADELADTLSAAEPLRLHRMAHMAATQAGAPVRFYPWRQPPPPAAGTCIVPLAPQATGVQLRQWRAFVAKGNRLLLMPGIAREREQNALQTDANGSRLAWLIGATDVGPSAAEGLILTARPDSVRAYAPPGRDSLQQTFGVSRRIGTGMLTYLGPQLASYLEPALEDLYQQANLPIFRLGRRVWVGWHQGLLVVLNNNKQPFAAGFPSQERILGQGTDIAPGDVGVFKQYR